MKATLSGFEWNLPDCLTLDEYVAHLRSLKGEQIEHGDYQRLLSVGVKGEYYAGMFLTIKNHRKWTEIVEKDGGTFSVSVRTIAKGRKPLDFNLFVVNKNTGRGLYLHYHNSCSINQFGLFCKRRFNNLRQSMRDLELAALGQDQDVNKKKRKAIKRKFSEREAFNLDLIVRPERIEELMRTMERVATFEYAVTTIAANDSRVAPLGRFAARDRRIIRFLPKADQGALKNTLATVLRSGEFIRGRVTGKDAGDRDVAYSLFNNPDIFGEHNYDDVIADNATLNLEDPTKSPFIDVMLETIQTDEAVKALFETQAV